MQVLVITCEPAILEAGIVFGSVCVCAYVCTCLCTQNLKNYWSEMDWLDYVPW